MHKLEYLAWMADVTVLLSAWLTAQRSFPAVYFVSMVSAILFGVYSWVNDAPPLVLLDLCLFCMYTWGIVKHYRKE